MTAAGLQTTSLPLLIGQVVHTARNSMAVKSEPQEVSST